MNARSTAEFLQEKRNDLQNFLESVSINLEVHRREGLKLYFFPLPEELQLIQENLYLVNQDLYKEDHGTFTVIVKGLKDNLGVDNPADAHFVVLPLNFYYYHHLKGYGIETILQEARTLAGRRKLILFCIGDFCLKTVHRSTMFEKMLFDNLSNKGDFVIDLFEEDDVFIHFESTIDFLFKDISAFPLIDLKPSAFVQKDKEFLFSFVGEFTKAGWPRDFVRSPDNLQLWEKLKTRNLEISLLATSEEAQIKGYSRPFTDIPLKSTFTICPRGITSWSFRLFEAILSGSIPVILSDSYVKPFPRLIDWDRFTLSYPESELANIDVILRNIQPSTVHALSIHLNQNQHWFTSNGLVELIVSTLEEKHHENDI